MALAAVQTGVRPRNSPELNRGCSVRIRVGTWRILYSGHYMSLWLQQARQDPGSTPGILRSFLSKDFFSGLLNPVRLSSQEKLLGLTEDPERVATPSGVMDMLITSSKAMSRLINLVLSVIIARYNLSSFPCYFRSQLSKHLIFQHLLSALPQRLTCRATPLCTDITDSFQEYGKARSREKGLPRCSRWSIHFLEEKTSNHQKHPRRVMWFEASST